MRRKPQLNRKFAGRNRRAKAQGNAHQRQKLPKNTGPVELVIDQVGARGDGVGKALFTHNYETKEWLFFVPHALAGEQVRVQPHSLSNGGIQADLIELITPSADRIEPACPVAHDCGGCQFQHMQDEAYAKLKDNTVKAALNRAEIEANSWRPMMRSHAHSRRRVRFGFRRTASELIIGLHARLSDHLVKPIGCMTIDKTILHVRDQLAETLSSLLPTGMTGEMQLTKLDRGIDVFLNVNDPLSPNLLAEMGQVASQSADIVRFSLAVDGAADLPLYAPELPILSWPGAKIAPPPNSFLQATLSGEMALQEGVREIAEGTIHIVDLFCGSGTLSLPLLDGHRQIYAADNAGPALQAYRDAADASGRGGQLTIDTRNLFQAPMTAEQLSHADLIILDPPRSGAKDQIDTIAKSGVPKIAYVSCNPSSFAKEAAELISAGYRLDWCQPIDQFYLASHVELIAQFSLPLDEIKNAQI